MSKSIKKVSNSLPKIRNIIWLDAQDYIDLKKVYSPYQEYIASNEFITRVLRIVIHNQNIIDLVIPQMFQELKDEGIEIKPIEQIVIKEKISLECPFCAESFNGKGQKYLREHITEKHLKV